MKTSVKPDQRIISVIEKLRGAGYPVAVASNCIRDSVFYLLQGIGVHDLVTSYFSNEDVSAAKPDPEIYLAAAEHFGVRADEMVVVEDSNHGKQAALLAGALLCPVGCPADVTIDRLSNALATKLYSQPPLNILLPMAGSESMFINGSVVPKFLIDVNGESLLKRIVTNLQPNRPHRFIFVARQYQAKTYKLAEMCVKACDYNPTVLLTVKQKSGSALETCLVAREYINSGAPLLIANLNTWPVMMRDAINVDSLSRINADCVLTHFESSNEMFSYIKLNDRFDVTSISTKAKTSNLATTGYTLFKNGSTFISLCDAVLRARAQEIPPTSNVYLEDVANTALKKHMTVASVPVECIPIRNNDDIDKLRAALMD
jgi:choline kinase